MLGVAVQEEVGVSLALEASDATAELVQLGEAEAVGALDNDRVAVGDIEAVLDDRGADKDVRFAGDKARHHPFQLQLGHLAMADGNGSLGHEVAELGGDRIDRLHAIVQVKDLSAALELACDGLLDELGIVGAHEGLDRQAVGRWGLDDAEVAGPHEREVEGTGNGVALMESTSTSVLNCLRRSLWRTPKRCSSSMTRRPRLAKRISLLRSRWVPMTRSTFPSGDHRLTMRFC
jgi:hypothetical protein